MQLRLPIHLLVTLVLCGFLVGTQADVNSTNNSTSISNTVPTSDQSLKEAMNALNATSYSNFSKDKPKTDNFPDK